MPRIAKPIAPKTVRARDELRRYLHRRGMSANALARAAGVGQPAVSRFLGGRTKTITPVVEVLLSYAEIDWKIGIDGGPDLLNNPRIREALQRFGDGKPESADLLARIIDALGPVINSTPSVTTRSKL